MARQSLYDLIVKLSADVAGLKTGFDDAANQFKRLGEMAETTNVKLMRMGESASRIGSQLSVALTLPLTGVGVAALKVSGDLEQARVAFTTLLGSATAAQMHLEELRKFAMRTPFEFPDLVTASKRLQALGFSAAQVIPMMTAIGNAAAALGTGAEGISRISLALGQMQAKGKVSAEEMRQLAEAGIPAWQILAAAMSKAEGRLVTVAEAMKRAEKSFIDGKFAVQELQKGMQDAFGGLMEAQSKTLLGTWSNFKDQATKVLTDIGDALAPAAKQVLDGLMTVARGVEGAVLAFRQLPQGLQTATLGFLALAAAAGPATFVVGQTATAIGRLIPVFGSITASIDAFSGNFLNVFNSMRVLGVGVISSLSTALSAVLLPALTAVGTALAAVGAVILAWKVGELVGELINLGLHFVGLGDSAKQSAQAAGEAKGFWDNFFDTFKASKIEAEGKKITSAAQFMGAALRGVFTGAIELLDLAIGRLQAMRFNVEQFTVSANRAAQDFINKTREGMRAPAGGTKLPKFAEELLAGDEGVKASEAIRRRMEQQFAGAAEAAKKAAAAIDAAFSKLGLSKAKNDVAELTAAYSLLERKGLLTYEMHVQGLNKIADATKNAQRATRGLIENMDGYRRAWEQFGKVDLALDSERRLKSLRSMFPHEWFEEQKRALKQLDELHAAMDKIASVASRSGIEVTRSFLKPWAELGDALKKFNVITTEEASRQFEILDKQYSDILSKTELSTFQRLELEKKYLEERRRLWLAGAVDADFTAANQTRLNQLDEMLAASVGKQKKSYEKIRTVINSIRNDLEKGIADAIVHWESAARTFKKIAQEIAETVLRLFVKIALDATRIFDKLEAALTNLFKRLAGSIIDNLGGALDKVGKAAGDVVDKIPTPTTIPGGLPGGKAPTPTPTPTPTPGPGGGGAGAGGGGGFEPISGISAIVTAISSVVANFQFAHMNTALGRIEESTRYIKIWTGENGAESLMGYTKGAMMRLQELKDAFFDYLSYFASLMTTAEEIRDAGAGGGMKDLRDSWFSDFMPAFASLMSTVEQIRDKTGGATVQLTGTVGDISEPVANGITRAIEGVFDNLVTLLTEIRDHMVNQMTPILDGIRNYLRGIPEAIRAALDGVNISTKPGATVTAPESLPAGASLPDSISAASESVSDFSSAVSSASQSIAAASESIKETAQSMSDQGKILGPATTEMIAELRRQGVVVGSEETPFLRENPFTGAIDILLKLADGTEVQLGYIDQAGRVITFALLRMGNVAKNLAGLTISLESASEAAGESGSSLTRGWEAAAKQARAGAAALDEWVRAQADAARNVAQALVPSMRLAGEAVMETASAFASTAQVAAVAVPLLMASMPNIETVAPTVDLSAASAPASSITSEAYRRMMETANQSNYAAWWQSVGGGASTAGAQPLIVININSISGILNARELPKLLEESLRDRGIRLLG